MDKITFSNKLKELLKQNNMTQKELSERSKINKNLINKYINNITIPKQENLIKIANALNVNISVFYNFDKNNQNVNYTMIDLLDSNTNEYISAIPFYYENEQLEPSEFVALKSINSLKHSGTTLMNTIIYIHKTDILVNRRLFLLRIDGEAPIMYTVYSKGQGFLQLINVNNFRMCDRQVNVYDNDIEIIGQVLKVETTHTFE